MGAAKQYGFRKQQGISLTSIIFVLIILGSLLVLAMRITPALVEYKSIKNAIVQAKAAGGSVGEMRRAFDTNTRINDVEAIRGKDLEITREDGETQIAFAYEKRIPLAANASLVLAFSGSTDPKASGPSKTAAADK